MDYQSDTNEIIMAGFTNTDPPPLKRQKVNQTKLQSYNVTATSLQVFKVAPMSKYQKQFPFFREPKEVGCFSHDKDRKVVQTSQELKYYIPPSDPNSVAFDLNLGYNTFIKKDESVKEYLDDLLKWVVANKSKFDVQGSVLQEGLNTDFICWRGLMTKLACTPYENRDGWKIAVIRYKNTWYMCEYDTEERIQQKAQMDEKQKQMTYMGWKFEQYVTADSPKGEPDVTKPVNNKEGYCSVVRSRLAEHSLVFGGEVDCTDVTDSQTDHATLSKHYVELKTTYEFKHAGQERNFKRFKLIKFWAQSFLIGIGRIIVGFKDQQGVVRRLEEYPTMKIPSLVKDIQNPWEPTVCFNFVHQFLHHVKKVAIKDDPLTSYVFEWKPRQDIMCTLYEGESEYSFLPKWYYQ